MTGVHVTKTPVPRGHHLIEVELIQLPETYEFEAGRWIWKIKVNCTSIRAANQSLDTEDQARIFALASLATLAEDIDEWLRVEGNPR